METKVDRMVSGSCGHHLYLCSYPPEEERLISIYFLVGNVIG